MGYQSRNKHALLPLEAIVFADASLEKKSLRLVLGLDNHPRFLFVAIIDLKSTEWKKSACRSGCRGSGERGAEKYATMAMRRAMTRRGPVTTARRVLVSKKERAGHGHTFT